MSPPNPIIPPPRYEIRPLLPQHIPFARAIITHSNIFHSPVWTKIYPSNQTPRAYTFYLASENLMTLNIASGHSYGLFDTQYIYKRPESAATEGKLHWDFNDMTATAEDLLEQMDFPLVSIAMAWDAAEPGRDGSEWGPAVAAMPRLGTLFTEIEKNDKRDVAIWKPKEMGQVIYRGGTSTRADYEGQGLAKVLAHWCLWRWREQGFRGMQAGVAHRAVVRIFTNPPEGMRGEVVAVLDTKGYEEVGEDGERVRPFEAVGDVPCVRVWVDLK
ncbi:hypothetical protein B0T16DRAFT_320923 [Cercophora newfieldiana]|uniref:Uncharacterized protein n=1 Tax=Cercophora newfieldiana TaxID=92897 RepID=A0AA39YE85_9PEZI|nr:hypothetical protein B0T16DRAFT_320923 [Cercophora newfieldiana]